MSYVPLEKVIDKAEHSLYKLVILASKRALEIAEGMPKMIEVGSDVKSTSVALEEIAAGKVKCKAE